MRLLALSVTTGAVLTVTEPAWRGLGLGLAEVPVEARADRAADAAPLGAEELLAACPEPSGAAAAVAAPAPETITKPAPMAKPKVVIRPARLLEVTLAPAHDVMNENRRDHAAILSDLAVTCAVAGANWAKTAV